MFVTSYFANHRKLKEAGFLIVSIARYTPPGVLYNLRAFAPEKDLLLRRKQGLVSDEEYTKSYLEQLNSLDRKEVVDLLESIPGKVALCCYCGKDKFCHRHILSKWLKDNFNIEINEF